MVAGEPNPSQLGTVVAIVGAALLVTGLGDALARTGHQSPALPMFFTGLIAIFVPCAWRLTSAAPARGERVAVSLVLGIGLLASYYMRSPLIFDWFDELIHGATLNRLLDSRTLLVHNSILPVSPYYPGLELVTVAVKWMTGLPVVLAQLVVVLAERVVLVLCVFLVVERVCGGSARAGGIGVLVYATNPSFYTFASWDYGPFALVFAVATVHFLLSSIDEQARVSTTTVGSGASVSIVEPSRQRFLRTHRDLMLALASFAALVVTHHLTAWLTAGLLVVWAVGLWIDGRRDAARLIGLAAAVSLILLYGWTAFVGGHLFSYLGPLLSTAVTGFSFALEHHQSSRRLFHTSASQGGSSRWEIVVMLAAAVCFCLVLVPSVFGVIRKRTANGGVLRFLPVVVAAGYPFAMLASLSSGSSQVGERATTFIFFGMAIVIGVWLATRISIRRSLLERAATLLIATVCFLGSMIFGSGPDVTYVPGPYLVGANQRSFSAPSLAVAQWASTHLPAGSNVAADRQNGALLADLGDLNFVTNISGLADPTPLFFSQHFDPYELSLIRKDRIRYIVVDLRLASSLPLFDTYIEPGEAKPGTRLTIAELSKFDSVRGANRVYDNGPIQVYDVSRLLGLSPYVRSGGPEARATGTDPVVLIAAIAVAIIWLVRARRRRPRLRITDQAVVRWIVGLMVFGLVVAAATIPSHLPPTAIGLGGLGAVLVISLAATRTRPPSGAIPIDIGSGQPSETQPVSGRLQLGRTTAGVGVLVAAILWARRESASRKVGSSASHVVRRPTHTNRRGLRPRRSFSHPGISCTGVSRRRLIHDSLRQTSAARPTVVLSGEPMRRQCPTERSVPQDPSWDPGRQSHLEKAW